MKRKTVVPNEYDYCPVAEAKHVELWSKHPYVEETCEQADHRFSFCALM